MTYNKTFLRGTVMTWTILTTTFFWTSTMRILMKPEISSWSIFQAGGKGFMGDFWLPPLIVLFALLLFYIEGRGKLRPLYHFMLISWHLLISVIIVYGSFHTQSEISFGTWGISFSMFWLLIPFILFLVLSIVSVILESKNKYLIPAYSWTIINRKPLYLALFLLPVALLFFWLGEGFNWLVKIAVGATIIQWILLADALGRPYSIKSRS